MAAIKRLVAAIAYVDGHQVRYPIRAKAEMLFERSFGVGLDKLNAGNEGATNVLRLCWLAQKENLSDYPGVLPDFDAWVDLVDSATVDSEDIRPFVGGAPADGSHNSQSPQESLPVSS